jgi:DNA processing protein
VTIPAERIGLVFVFRTFERISYAWSCSPKGPSKSTTSSARPRWTPGESLADWLRLTLIPGIGGETQRKLLAAFGLPEAIFRCRRSALRQVSSATAKRRDCCSTPTTPPIERALDWANTPTSISSAWPTPSTRSCCSRSPDPPTLLYVRGRLELLNRPALAIVGSRNPTPQGSPERRAFRHGRSPRPG